jgi:hypothetical protein
MWQCDCLSELDAVQDPSNRPSACGKCQQSGHVQVQSTRERTVSCAKGPFNISSMNSLTLTHNLAKRCRQPATAVHCQPGIFRTICGQRMQQRVEHVYITAFAASTAANAAALPSAHAFVLHLPFPSIRGL